MSIKSVFLIFLSNFFSNGLKLDREPDETVAVKPIVCDGCGADLSGEPKFHANTRYVFDVEIRVVLTKYEMLEAVCPKCGMTTSGEPPVKCRGSVSYGNTLHKLCVVLTQSLNATSAT